MKRGFTLIEVCVCIAIMATLAAILTPVFSEAKKSSQIQSSLSRLRQLHIAVQVYRTDHEMGGYTVAGLGLPPREYVYDTNLGMGREFWTSPCGYVASIEPNLSRMSYQYVVSRGDREDPYFTKYEDNALLFSDPHCNPSGTVWGSRFIRKRGLGVLLSGQLVNHFKPGFPGDLSWWSSPVHP